MCSRFRCSISPISGASSRSRQTALSAFPLIGRIKAGGLTLRGFELELHGSLADGYFRNPQVTVAVEQYRSQRVFVMGEVRQPGPVALTGGHDAHRGAGARRVDAADRFR